MFFLRVATVKRLWYNSRRAAIILQFQALFLAPVGATEKDGIGYHSSCVAVAEWTSPQSREGAV